MSTELKKINVQPPKFALYRYKKTAEGYRMYTDEEMEQYQIDCKNKKSAFEQNQKINSTNKKEMKSKSI
jgi:hypothetical protein